MTILEYFLLVIVILSNVFWYSHDQHQKSCMSIHKCNEEMYADYWQDTKHEKRQIENRNNFLEDVLKNVYKIKLEQIRQDRKNSLQ